MKKIVIIIVLLFFSVSAHAAIEVLEDFNSYASGTNALNNPALDYNTLGSEATGSTIVGDDVNNSLQIDFDSAVGQSNAWFSFGVIHNTNFAAPKDLTGEQLSFYIKTDLSQTWVGVLSPQLTVWTYHPGTNTWAYEPWRLQNMLGDIDGSSQPLLDLDVNHTGWTPITVDVEDLVFNGNEQHWKTADFTNVIAMDILVLQVNTDIVGPGTVLIDDIAIGAIPEPGAMMLCGFGGLIALIKKRLRN